MHQTPSSSVGQDRLILTRSGAGAPELQMGCESFAQANDRGGQAPALRAMDDFRRGGQAPALRATDDFLYLIKTRAKSMPIISVPFWQLMGRFGRRKGLRHDKLLIHSEVL